ncbi:MAG TPA: indole-3-glycerol phosphate synthase TrpC [Solirubrobacteraceae bacterium]|nr:indole-3-glycerol phosphate synthase TrpC [Solirubrobacteraceae bacterium]
MSVPSVLEGILASTRAELARREHELPLAALEREALDERESRPAGRPRLARALAGPGLRVIAEFKRRSPSAGTLREGAELEQIVRAYERGGASALSVLTEGPNFGGSLEDLRRARAASPLPLLRKDFVLAPYQLYEAVAAGADAVLLIVAALAQEELRALHARARELGLDVLVEVHDSRELAGALAVGANLIGINNRDLRDFSVDVHRTARLLGEIPAGVSVVSESGISSHGQLRALAAEGVHAVLVGERLMRAPDTEAALRELLGGAEEAGAQALSAAAENT